MELSKNLFDEYLKKRINLESFIEKIGLYETDFLDNLLYEMEETLISQDADRLEQIIYVLSLWEERVDEKEMYRLNKFVDRLNELVVSDWHYQHENIVLLLEEISSAKSIEYIYRAIELKPHYLSWDDNYAFEVKCVRAIYHIGKEKSFSYLEKLCKHPNDIIREMAQRQIKKLI